MPLAKRSKRRKRGSAARWRSRSRPPRAVPWRCCCPGFRGLAQLGAADPCRRDRGRAGHALRTARADARTRRCRASAAAADRCNARAAACCAAMLARRCRDRARGRRARRAARRALGRRPREPESVAGDSRRSTRVAHAERRAGPALSRRGARCGSRGRARGERARGGGAGPGDGDRARSRATTMPRAIFRAKRRSARGRTHCRRRKRCSANCSKPLADLPFRDDAFAPFVADVERTRAGELLRAKRSTARRSGSRSTACSRGATGAWVALAAAIGVTAPQTIREALGDATLARPQVGGGRARRRLPRAVAALDADRARRASSSCSMSACARFARRCG